MPDGIQSFATQSRGPRQKKPDETNDVKIAYLTSGAGGMYCGSCLRDNTLARHLMQLGCDVELLPTYTPIRTDEVDVSSDRVLYGGINVFLQEKVSLFRHVPRILDAWLDRPRLLRWATFGRIQTNAAELGGLTVSMLRGEHGHQKKEVLRLVDYLADHARPDVVNLSNMLIAGFVPALKRRRDAPVLVTLQGDDLFLADLPERDQRAAIDAIGAIAPHVDGYITFSNYYADFMSAWLRLPREKFHLAPLGIDVDDFAGELPPRPADCPPTIGFLARHCPAKGLHVLVEAYLKLRAWRPDRVVRLHTAGWLGEGDRAYFDEQVARLRAAGFERDCHFAGVVDRRQKVEFLRSIDVFSAPTTYREPKGLFVLEALASGVPVVQPAHGAFPELLEATGGGRLVPPNDADALADALDALVESREEAAALGRTGREAVLARFHAAEVAARTLAIYREVARR
ncbi:MAG: hexosyltransferase [Planctomycetota bacterium]|nr:MAG: hexosyltransferase [Planctomycetota bacterium]